MRRALAPLLALLAAWPAPAARGQARIAHLRPAGPDAAAPDARPDLVAALRARPGFKAAVAQDVVDPADPRLVRYPVVYWQARRPIPPDAPGLAALRHHLTRGGGTLLADAAGGDAGSDAAARRAIELILPGRALEPIPPGDPIHATRGGFDLAHARRTDAAGGMAGPPELKGVKVDGRWAVVYSRLDLGSALQGHAGPDGKGYDRGSAARIAANVVIYATRP